MSGAESDEGDPPPGDSDTPPQARPGDDRTIFAAAGMPTAVPRAPDAEAGERTMFAGATAMPAMPPPRPSDGETIPAPIRSPGPPPPVTTPPIATAFTPRPGGRLQPGDVLNGIYEVRRFIAAGGMGEVWEGVSVHSDERVAIKVMLPHLAQDPNVQAMFRKEASTLTRLAHPALVSYRMLAVEPGLGVLYIVTEFVDGRNLGEHLGDVPHDADSLRRLTRRLAEGLQVAHEAGAVHRDLSPDNVLLEGGDLRRARIIDFGIAKDLDAAKGTIIGDGFAGKLGYVAPEQLGDFGRDVGPWTDVYSLGLVVLAVALGSAPDMGATLVDAVDRRRAGVDVSAAPEPVRAVLARMLRADPAQRLRSMDDVITALETIGGATVLPTSLPAPVPIPAKPAKPRLPRPTLAANPAGGRRPLRLLAGGGAGVLALAGLGWWALAPHHPSAPRPAVPAPSAPALVAPVADPAAALRAAAARVRCSWLTVASTSDRDGHHTFAVTGVAGRRDEAGNQLTSEATRIGAPIDTTGIMQIDPKLCPAVETFSQVRAPGPPMMSVDHLVWKMLPGEVGNTRRCANKSRVAKYPIYFDQALKTVDWTFGGVGPDGARLIISDGRNTASGGVLNPIQDGRLSTGDNLRYCDSGVIGYFLIRGNGFLDKGSIQTDDFSAKWRQRFLSAAKANGWTVELLWLKVENSTQP